MVTMPRGTGVIHIHTHAQKKPTTISSYNQLPSETGQKINAIIFLRKGDDPNLQQLEKDSGRKCI